jgi:hypothetical protein
VDKPAIKLWIESNRFGHRLVAAGWRPLEPGIKASRDR